MSSEPLAIIAQGLGKTYQVFERPLDRLKQAVLGSRRHYGRAFTALHDVSFSVPRGSVLGVVGNNGAGKSTLLQLVCQTLKPSAGSLTVHGRVAALLELGAGFNPEFSGRENIHLNATILGLSPEEIGQRFDSIVSFSGIGHFIEQPVKTYSSGMYVRLAFAIATSVDPDILIIDEALSVGDGEFARKSFDRIMELKAKGATILFCSHSMYQIEALCDQAIWLERGRMVMLDSPQEVTRAYAAKSLPQAADAALKATPDVAASPAVDVQGHAKFERIEVSADDIVGSKLTLVAGESTLRIRAHFRFDPALTTPVIAYGIETVDGLAITSGSMAFDQVQADVTEAGKAQVLLTFPNFSLMRGRYRLTVFLSCENTIHVYDQALYCAELLVTHHGVEQGVCFLPHAWDDGPLRTVPRLQP